MCCIKEGFPGGSEVKASASNVGDPGSIPGSGRPPGEGKGNPLQYSCLENPMGRGAWRVTESDTTEGLNNNNAADKVMQKFQRQLVPVTSIVLPTMISYKIKRNPSS